MKKRVRGLRRHSRNHQARAAIPEELDTKLLAEYNVACQQLGLQPWTVSGKPPLTIRLLWLARLLADFQQWQQPLAQAYPSFYLAIWLFEPRFGQSQLVAAINERKTRYEGLFGSAVEVPLPDEYRRLPGVDKLQWTAYADVETLAPEEFAEYHSWYSRKPYWPGETPGGEACIVVQVGWVWVGELPT